MLINARRRIVWMFHFMLAVVELFSLSGQLICI